MNAISVCPRVIIFTGLPGTGKSTLAERTARTLGAPSFAGDWLMGGLKPAHAALAKLDRSEYVAAWFGLLRTLVIRQLMLDQSAVVDDIVSDSQFALWRETADNFAARLSLIECVCSDEAVHRTRIEGRVRGIPGWHEVGWDHVERMRAEVPPVTADRLIVDAMEPVENNLRRVFSYIASRVYRLASLDLWMVAPGWHGGHVVEHLSFDVLLRGCRVAARLPRCHPGEALIERAERSILVGAVVAVPTAFDGHAAAFTA